MAIAIQLWPSLAQALHEAIEDHETEAVATPPGQVRRQLAAAVGGSPAAVSVPHHHHDPEHCGVCQTIVQIRTQGLTTGPIFAVVLDDWASFQVVAPAAAPTILLTSPRNARGPPLPTPGSSLA